MLIKTKNFSSTELERFRGLQRRSFEILESTASNLQGGESEKEIARSLVKQYRAAGADSFFHLPVVLFGERTALPGNWSVNKFFPKARELKAGDSVILDAAPLFGGYLVDTSYSFCFGESDTHSSMMIHLQQYRDAVCDAVNEGQSFADITESVRRSMEAANYEPVHHKHPGEVLGHRTIKLPRLPMQPRLQGFDAISLSWFKFKDNLAMRGLGKESPLWNASKASMHSPHDGLWLVEPHAGAGDTGAKWEEILVIENGHATWLDANPPHMWQWSQIAENKSYQPRKQNS